MARRQRTSPLEDLILIASKLPWWVSILLAIISYFVLHHLATRPLMPVTVAPGQMGAAINSGIITSLSMLGQLVFPFAFGLAAIISGVRSLKQRKLYENVKSRSDVASLNEMTWEEFETVVGEYFRRDGFQVAREGGNGPDGGVDLVLRRGREKRLVQCKQWKAYKVGVQPVREFYGVMAASGAAGGYFVTSGVFTNDAKSFVEGLNLTLIEGRQLKAMIGIAGKTGPVPFAELKPPVTSPSASAPSAVPACPKCGSEMKRRVVRKGANAGKEFWGCSTYPQCNGTRVLEDAPVPRRIPATPAVAQAEGEKKSCPHCGTDLVLRQFLSGPKEGQQFYGCVPCKKGWAVT